MAVYFIQRTTGGLVKIGTTTRLSSRLKALRYEVRELVWVLGVLPGGREVEKAMHDQFSHLRREGEWFEPDGELLRFVASKTGEWDGSDESPRGPLVMLEPDVARLARIIAAYRSVSLSEYIRETLRDVVGRDYDAEMEKMADLVVIEPPKR